MDKDKKKCKKCKEEIDKDAKKCPHCGANQGIPKWIIVVIIIVVIGLIAGATGSNEESSSNNGGKSTSNGTKQQEIEYIKVDRDEMTEALKDNAAAAKDTYYKKYVEVTGKLGTIDSDLSYISLVSRTDQWDIVGMTCYIRNDEQKNIVKSLTKDQNITVKGQITEVGEVLGYSMNLTEIIPN